MMVEVPFAIRLEEKKIPTVVRGAVDLAFREKDGWILVDYKTDVVPKSGPDALIRRYAPQLELYARAWSRCTGQPVVENGLFFTGINRYCIIDDAKCGQGDLFADEP